MSSKQKQVVTSSVFVGEDAYDDNQPVFDAAYFKSLAHKEAAPDKKDVERQQQIQSLYPSYRQKVINLNELDPAPEEWNYFKKSPSLIEELMKNIVIYGQQSPAIVWQQENGRYMILGGHTRWQALKELHELFLKSGDTEEAARYSTMYCNVYAYDTLDDIEARKIIIYDNMIRRDNTTALKVRSIINMNRLIRDTRPSRRPSVKRERIAKQISDLFGTSEGTVKGLYQLRNLIPEFWPLIDEKQITQQMARAVSLLPENLQKEFYNSGLYQKHWGSRQMRQLSKAQSMEDIEGILTEPSDHVMHARVVCQQPAPEGYKAVIIPCSVTEMHHIRERILQMMDEDPEVSETTKQIFRNIR